MKTLCSLVMIVVILMIVDDCTASSNKVDSAAFNLSAMYSDTVSAYCSSVKVDFSTVDGMIDRMTADVLSSTIYPVVTFIACARVYEAYPDQVSQELMCNIIGASDALITNSIEQAKVLLPAMSDTDHIIALTLCLTFAEQILIELRNYLPSKCIE